MAQLTRKEYDRQDAHVANVRHGVATGPWRIDYVGKVKVQDSAYNIKQGSVVSLNADGEFVIGCPAATGINCPVPFISLKNVFDPDVTTGKEGASMATTTYSAMGGNIVAIPTTCGYELETTEFDADATYAINDGVIAATAAGKVGKITVATAAPGGADSYLGFVSEAPHADYFKNTRIAFLAHFIPGGIGAAGVSSTFTIPADDTYTKVVVSDGNVTFTN